MTVTAYAEIIKKRCTPCVLSCRDVQCGALSTAVLWVSGTMAPELWG